MINPKSLKEALKSRLTAKQLAALNRSYDLLGDVAIVEISPLLKKKEKLIASTLLGMHPNLKVVCKKEGKHYGLFRKQRLRIIGGEKRKEALYKENGITLKFHVENCYFSPRLASERKRISSQVNFGEHVLVMFSGVGPYPLTISKNSHAKDVLGVEINPQAHKYALLNKAINKAENVTFFYGDVRKIVPVLRKKFDRIVMPLPKGAESFLDIAFKAAKKGAIIHFYDFEHEDEICKAESKVRDACKQNSVKCRIIKVVRCGQYSPRKYRICVDFQKL